MKRNVQKLKDGKVKLKKLKTNRLKEI